MVAEMQHGKGNNGAKLDRDAGGTGAIATASRKKKKGVRAGTKPATNLDRDADGKLITVGCVVMADGRICGRVELMIEGVIVWRPFAGQNVDDSQPMLSDHHDALHVVPVDAATPMLASHIATIPERVGPPQAPLYVQHALSLLKMLDFLSAHIESFEAVIPEGWGDDVQSSQIGGAIRVLHDRLTGLATWCMTGRLTDDIYRAEVAKQESGPTIEYRSVRHLNRILALMDSAISEWWGVTPQGEPAASPAPTEVPIPKVSIDGFGPVATKCLEMALMMEHAIQRFEEIRDMAGTDDPFSDDEKMDSQLQDIHAEFFTAACNAQRCADFNQRVWPKR